MKFSQIFTTFGEKIVIFGFEKALKSFNFDQ
jgi:hypothetical protein